MVARHTFALTRQQQEPNATHANQVKSTACRDSGRWQLRWKSGKNAWNCSKTTCDSSPTQWKLPHRRNHTGPQPTALCWSPTPCAYAIFQRRVKALDHVLVTDWISSNKAMKGYDIDKYLADINTIVDHLGGRVDLIGLCQGGWISTIFAARFPAKVRSLVLAGTPSDTDAGNGVIKRLVHSLSMGVYRKMVTAGAACSGGPYWRFGRTHSIAHSTMLQPTPWREPRLFAPNGARWRVGCVSVQTSDAAATSSMRVPAPGCRPSPLS